MCVLISLFLISMLYPTTMTLTMMERVSQTKLILFFSWSQFPYCQQFFYCLNFLSNNTNTRQLICFKLKIYWEISNLFIFLFFLETGLFSVTWLTQVCFAILFFHCILHKLVSYVCTIFIYIFELKSAMKINFCD